MCRHILPLLGAVLVASESAAPAVVGDRPRLLVLIVVDQFGRNLLEHHEQHLSGGLRRLIDGGRRYRDAVVDHAPTNSLPGHLTIATGAHPRRHGIIDNSWVETGAAGNERITGFVDPGCSPIGPSGAVEESGRAIGPARFEAPTIVEWALSANSRARFASVGSGAGVSALHAGSARGAVLWFDALSGGYVSSTCYAERLPDWALAFNARLRHDFMNQDWTMAAPLAMTAGLREDESAFENGGRDTAFPHVRPNEAEERARWFANSPFMDVATLRLAEMAIAGEELGADAVTDVLTIGVSSLDHIGHNFGPFSVEQADALYRLDAALGDFFAFLDRQVGEGRWAVALTADHGAPPAPEAAHRFGVEAALRISRQQALAAIEKIAVAAAGADDAESRTRAAARAAEELDFVQRVLVVSEVERLAGAGDPVARLYSNSFRPGRVSLHPLYDDAKGRSPADYGFIIIPQPYAVVDWAASIHGSPFHYDRQVVMLYYGADVVAGTVEGEARTVDVAPTLGALAGIAPPAPIDGRRLEIEVR